MPYDAFSRVFSSGELYLLRVGFDSGGLEEIFQRIYDLNYYYYNACFVMITVIRLRCYVGIIYYSYYVFVNFVGLKLFMVMLFLQGLCSVLAFVFHDIGSNLRSGLCF